MQKAVSKVEHSWVIDSYCNAKANFYLILSIFFYLLVIVWQLAESLICFFLTNLSQDALENRIAQMQTEKEAHMQKEVIADIRFALSFVGALFSAYAMFLVQQYFVCMILI